MIRVKCRNCARWCGGLWSCVVIVIVDYHPETDIPVHEAHDISLETLDLTKKFTDLQSMCMSEIEWGLNFWPNPAVFDPVTRPSWFDHWSSVSAKCYELHAPNLLPHRFQTTRWPVNRSKLLAQRPLTRFNLCPLTDENILITCTVCKRTSVKNVISHKLWLMPSFTHITHT